MPRNIQGGLGPKGTKLIAFLRAEGKKVFTTTEALRVTGGNSHAVTNLLYNLIRKKKVLRLEKGKYLIIPPEAWKSGEYVEEGILVASHLTTPYYLSFWTALHYHGYTEQPPRTVYVVSTKRKLPIVVKGVRFQFVRFRPQRFFGFSEVWVSEEKVNLAEPEKAIVDGLDQPRYCGDITEVAKGLWNGREELDFEKVFKYAKRMGNRAIFKRLGYLMEALGVNRPAVFSKLLTRKSQGYSPLDPGGGARGKYNNRWQLFVNVDPKTLTEWREH